MGIPDFQKLDKWEDITLSSDDMQNQIKYFYDFCMKWRLKSTVKIEKSIKYDYVFTYMCLLTYT